MENLPAYLQDFSPEFFAKVLEERGELPHEIREALGPSVLTPRKDSSFALSSQKTTQADKQPIEPATSGWHESAPNTVILGGGITPRRGTSHQCGHCSRPCIEVTVLRCGHRICMVCAATAVCRSVRPLAVRLRQMSLARSLLPQPPGIPADHLATIYDNDEEKEVTVMTYDPHVLRVPYDIMRTLPAECTGRPSVSDDLPRATTSFLNVNPGGALGSYATVPPSVNDNRRFLQRTEGNAAKHNDVAQSLTTESPIALICPLCCRSTYLPLNAGLVLTSLPEPGKTMPFEDKSLVVPTDLGMYLRYPDKNGRRPTPDVFGHRSRLQLTTSMAYRRSYVFVPPAVEGQLATFESASSMDSTQPISASYANFPDTIIPLPVYFRPPQYQQKEAEVTPRQQGRSSAQSHYPIPEGAGRCSVCGTVQGEFCNVQNTLEASQHVSFPWNIDRCPLLYCQQCVAYQCYDCAMKVHATPPSVRNHILVPFDLSYQFHVCSPQDVLRGGFPEDSQCLLTTVHAPSDKSPAMSPASSVCEEPIDVEHTSIPTKTKRPTVFSVVARRRSIDQPSKDVDAASVSDPTPPQFVPENYVWAEPPDLICSNGLSLINENKNTDITDSRSLERMTHLSSCSGSTPYGVRDHLETSWLKPQLQTAAFHFKSPLTQPTMYRSSAERPVFMSQRTIRETAALDIDVKQVPAEFPNEKSVLIDYQCPLHPTEPVRFFCLECETASFCGCCCVERQHEAHDVQVNGDAWQVLRNLKLQGTIQTRLEDLLNDSLLLEPVIHQIRDVTLHHVSDAKQAVEQSLEDLTTALQNSGLQLLSECDEFLERITTDVVSLESDIADTISVYSAAQKALQIGSRTTHHDAAVCKAYHDALTSNDPRLEAVLGKKHADPWLALPAAYRTRLQYFGETLMTRLAVLDQVTSIVSRLSPRHPTVPGVGATRTEDETDWQTFLSELQHFQTMLAKLPTHRSTQTFSSVVSSLGPASLKAEQSLSLTPQLQATPVTSFSKSVSEAKDQGTVKPPRRSSTSSLTSKTPSSYTPSTTTVKRKVAFDMKKSMGAPPKPAVASTSPEITFTDNAAVTTQTTVDVENRSSVTNEGAAATPSLIPPLGAERQPTVNHENPPVTSLNITPHMNATPSSEHSETMVQKTPAEVPSTTPKTVPSTYDPSDSSRDAKLPPVES